MGSLQLPFRVEKLVDGSSVAIVDMKGSIDGSTVKKFETETTALAQKGVKYLILNFREIGYMNSTGLGILVKVLDKYQELNGDMKLVQVPKKVRELFDMLGISSILHIYEDIAMALATLPQVALEVPAEPMDMLAGLDDFSGGGIVISADVMDEPPPTQPVGEEAMQPMAAIEIEPESFSPIEEILPPPATESQDLLAGELPSAEPVEGGVIAPLPAEIFLGSKIEPAEMPEAPETTSSPDVASMRGIWDSPISTPQPPGQVPEGDMADALGISGETLEPEGQEEITDLDETMEEITEEGISESAESRPEVSGSSGAEFARLSEMSPPVLDAGARFRMEAPKDMEGKGSVAGEELQEAGALAEVQPEFSEALGDLTTDAELIAGWESGEGLPQKPSTIAAKRESAFDIPEKTTGEKDEKKESPDAGRAMEEALAPLSEFEAPADKEAPEDAFAPLTGFEAPASKDEDGLAGLSLEAPEEEFTVDDRALPKSEVASRQTSASLARAPAAPAPAPPLAPAPRAHPSITSTAPAEPKPDVGGRRQEAAGPQPRPEAAATIKRKTTVRYYEQMNPQKAYPLVVAFSKEAIKKVQIDRVQQTTGKKIVEVKREQPEVTVTPCLAGCLVTPPNLSVDVTPETASADFWVTPVVEGNIVGWIDIAYQGENVERIPLKIRSARQTLAKISAFGAAISPILSYILDGFQLSLKQETFKGFLKLVATIDSNIGLYVTGGIFMALFIGAGIFFYLRNRPREAEILEKFLTVEPE